MFCIRSFFCNLLSLLLFSVLVACSGENKVPVSNANGTSDGGGGGIKQSSPEQVKKAVADVREEMLERFDFLRPAARHFELDFLLKTYSHSTPVEKNVIDAIWTVIGPRQSFLIERGHPDSIFEGDDYFTDISYDVTHPLNTNIRKEAEARPLHIRDFLPKIEYYFKEDGSCPSSTTPTADASVSSYDFSAKICFSTSRLSRIHPDSLKVYISELWFHELVHVVGIEDEVIASAAGKVIRQLFPHLEQYVYNAESIFLTHYLNIQQLFSDLLAKASESQDDELEFFRVFQQGKQEILNEVKLFESAQDPEAWLFCFRQKPNTKISRTNLHFSLKEFKVTLYDSHVDYPATIEQTLQWVDLKSKEFSKLDDNCQ